MTLVDLRYEECRTTFPTMCRLQIVLPPAVTTCFRSRREVHRPYGRHCSAPPDSQSHKAIRSDQQDDNEHNCDMPVRHKVISARLRVWNTNGEAWNKSH